MIPFNFSSQIYFANYEIMSFLINNFDRAEFIVMGIT